MQKFQAIGHIGQDPELNYTNAGDAVVNLSMATNEVWYDDSGEKQTRTEWHQLVAFGKKAETLAEYVNKGSQLYIEGKKRTRKWEDRDGDTRYSTEFIINRFEFLGGDSNAGNGSPRKRQGKGKSGAQKKRRKQQSNGNPQHNEDDEAFEPDDDLPF